LHRDLQPAPDRPSSTKKLRLPLAPPALTSKSRRIFRCLRSHNSANPSPDARCSKTLSHAGKPRRTHRPRRPKRRGQIDPLLAHPRARPRPMPDASSLERGATIGYLPQEKRSMPATKPSSTLATAVSVRNSKARPAHHRNTMPAARRRRRSATTNTTRRCATFAECENGHQLSSRSAKRILQRARLSRDRFRAAGENDERRLGHARAPGTATGAGA
jgi:hypothetical protein